MNPCSLPGGPVVASNMEEILNYYKVRMKILMDYASFFLLDHLSDMKKTVREEKPETKLLSQQYQPTRSRNYSYLWTTVVGEQII